MILLIPLRAEAEAPRLARVTLGIVAINCAAFLLTSGTETRRLGEEAARLERVADWTLRKAAQDRPGLEAERKRYPSAMAFLEREPGWRDAIADAEARQTLASGLGDYRELTRRHPFYAWGFVPSNLTPLRLVAHQFLHADLLHLLFNMLFLWVVGGLLEATWGATVFSAAYLLSGVAAALAHAASAPGSAEPAVGASGAVAGLMGAFAVAHPREPIRVAMVSMLAVAPRISFFSVPAAALFGFWLLEQVFWALMKAPLGIAFGAHVGGFAFGAALAFALRWAGLSVEA